MTYQNDELTRIAAQYQADNGMTDEEMADKLSIDPTRYMNFRTANGDGWSFYEACVLAEVTGCSLDKVAGIGLAHDAIDPDGFTDAVSKVKGCAAALTALYVQDAGRLTYDVELFETLAHVLHGAARYFDTVLETL